MNYLVVIINRYPDEAVRPKRRLHRASVTKPTCSNGNGRHALTYEQRTDALKLRTRQKARAKAEG